MSTELILPRVNISGSHKVSVINIEDGPDKAKDLVRETRKAFDAHKTKPLSFREKQLKNLLKFLIEQEAALCDALHKDLRKPKLEAVSHEIAFAAREARTALKNLRSWTKPERPDKSIANFFDKLYIYKDPYGVVLVVGALNFPVRVLVVPLIGAIAAGNCVVLKPSELAPATAQAFATLLPRYLDKECYPVVLGGPDETSDLLKQRFDYIFFTGSPQEAKVVYKAASKYLTPTNLQLEGRNPVYIDSTADMEMTARRVIWGKIQNSGQICVAPGYILCTRKVQEKFVYYADKALKEFFNGNAKISNDYGRIYSQKHLKRLTNLLKNQKIAIGGHTDPSDLFMHPTVVVDVDRKDPLMQEEIFGPILPIVNVEGLEDALNLINSGEKPLALYVFTNDKKTKQAFLERTSSGGVTINDTIMHVVAEGLPFGGVGGSGMGAYHGKKTFDNFVHRKSVLCKGFSYLGEKSQSIRYPPFTDTKLNLLRTIFRYNTTLPTKYIPHILMFLLGVLVTLAIFFIKWAFDEDN